jgi:hypothetical protein
MRKHVRILGWLQIVLGLFDLAIGAMAFGVLSTVGVMSGDMGGFGAMTGLGAMIVTIMAALALPNLLCGIGLLRNWGGWVIILACVLGIFNLAQAPFGTAIALYTFWIAYRLYETTPDSLPKDPA